MIHPMTDDWLVSIDWRVELMIARICYERRGSLLAREMPSFCIRK
jgi:hypothetical protein